MKLRVNPATGRLAERVPAELAYTDGTVADGPKWFTYHFERGVGLQVDLLSEQDVADWPTVVLAPAPEPAEFEVLIACSTCESSSTYAGTIDPHNAHDADMYAVRRQHPERPQDDPVPELAPGDEVTFRGSRKGREAGLVEAVVEGPGETMGADGEVVPGYSVRVNGKTLLVPGSALAKHAA